jgi:PAS domain S-box-containing protein
MLRAGMGHVVTTDRLDAAGFAAFVDSLDLEQHYRGIQGYGYAERLAPSEVEGFVQARRAEGPEDFRVWPANGAAEVVAITYLEPPDPSNRQALGFDMVSEPARRAAMERARDAGEPAASGRADLIRDVDADSQVGFLIYLPVYDRVAPPETAEERRDRLTGFIFATFRAGDLFRNTLLQWLTSQVAFEVYDGGPSADTLLYRSFEREEPGPHHLEAARSLTFAGRTWTIVHHSLPLFEATSSSDLVGVAPPVGIALSLLLTGVTWAQARARLAAQREAAERRRAEEAVAERESRLRRILNDIFAVIALLDRDGRIIEANRAALDLAGLEREDVLGRPFWEVEAWFRDDAARALMREAVGAAARGEVVRTDVEVPLADETIAIDMQIAPVLNDAGEVQFILPFGVDVTGRRRAEAHRATLLAELSHRVKNSLAVIQSIARQTAARTASMPDFLRAFEGRLGALAAAHGLLIEAGWRTARLESLIRAALKPHLAREEDQLTLRAEPVPIPSELAQNLALVVHELATNAVKYGALSTPGGHIAVDARMQGGALVLAWTERTEAPVAAPEKGGFGTTLLNALVAGRHGGQVEMDWRETGLACTITIPAEGLRAGADDDALAAGSAALDEARRKSA